MDAFEFLAYITVIGLLLMIEHRITELELRIREIQLMMRLGGDYEADEDEYSGAVIPANLPIDAGHNIDGRILDVSDSRPVSNRLMQERDY